MQKEFDKYVKKFDLNNKDIKLKYNHSYRVEKLNEKYAKKLNFSKEDVKLAKIIGLLHDIGRFSQLEIYDSYNDKTTIDHADLGIKILFENNLIKNFPVSKQDYEIIKFAIKNHNKFKIEKTSDKRKLMHAKLIRDTDKIDILFLLGYLKEKEIISSKDEISKEILKDFQNHKEINLNNIKNINDNITVKFAFAFDINNDICLEEFKTNLKYFYQTLNNKIFENIYLETIKYIDERIDKNAR